MARAGWKNWRGQEAERMLQEGAVEAVRMTCHAVLEAAELQVPHDEGTLQRSGMVLMAPDGSPRGLIVFGGGKGTGHPVVPYAVRWHENSAKFQKGRKSRYLADPYNQLAANTLIQAMQRVMRGKF